MNEGLSHVVCSCCDAVLAAHDAKENIAAAVMPYPCDEGFGWCRACFGDDSVKVEGKEPTEAQLRKRLGWAAETFFDARFDVLEKKLNAGNVERFRSMTYARKVAAVTRLIEKGVMI